MLQSTLAFCYKTVLGGILLIKRIKFFKEVYNIMFVIDKDTAKVLLVDFCKNDKTEFRYKKMVYRYLKPKKIGNIKDYMIVYYEIPWSEKDFLQLNLEKQRQILIKILKNGKKTGCVICGLPMQWRPILCGENLIEIPCGKQLALDMSVYELEIAVCGLCNKKTAVLGVDDKSAKTVTDKLLKKGCLLLLTGKKARSLADWYYKNQGLAIPVFRTDKACEAADVIFSLNGIAYEKYEKQTVVYKDKAVRIKGEWQKPFANGMFSCGLAAALIMAGGEMDLSKNVYRNEDGKQLIG